MSRLAEQVGYASEVAFHKAFARERGVTPGAYRREHSRRRWGAENTAQVKSCRALLDAISNHTIRRSECEWLELG